MLSICVSVCFKVAFRVNVIIFGQHLHPSLNFCYFSVPILVTVMILCKQLHKDRTISVASSMYGFDL